MFRIYQIHEFGGYYEDEYDIIRGTYLKKKKAEKRKEELELEEEQLQKCNNCPAIYGKCSREKMEKYCSEYEPFDKIKHNPDEVDSFRCVNYVYQQYESYFKIEEVEVEE